MCYFLSYKSFRGSGNGHCDYALLSQHGANPIESKTCFYTMYRTKERKENLSLLYGVRADYIKAKFLEISLTSLFFTILFVAIGLAAILTQSSYKELCLFSPIIGICVFLTVYNLYGYFKQKTKCKKYERDNFPIKWCKIIILIHAPAEIPQKRIRWSYYFSQIRQAATRDGFNSLSSILKASLPTVAKSILQ